MRYAKVFIILAAAAAVLTGCGSRGDSGISEPEKATVAVTKAEDTGVSSETELSADENDPANMAYWEASEELIPVTYKGDFEYGGAKCVKMADVFAIPAECPEIGAAGNQFIYVIDEGGICMRFIANMPAAVAKEHYELDILDDDYQKKELELVKELDIAHMDELSPDELSRGELDKLVGKTAEELEKEGFTQYGWEISESDGVVFFDKGFHRYSVQFSEPLTAGRDYDEEGALEGLTVKSIIRTGVSDNIYDTAPLLEDNSAER